MLADPLSRLDGTVSMATVTALLFYQICARRGLNATHAGEAAPPRAPMPCRAAARRRVACPRCGREVSVKVLSYSHVCGRTRDGDERARDMTEKAYVAVDERARRVSAERAAERELEQRRACWSRLAMRR